MRLLGIISTAVVCICLGSGQKATAADELCYEFKTCAFPLQPNGQPVNLMGYYPDGGRLTKEPALMPGDGGYSWTSTRFKVMVKWFAEGQEVKRDAQGNPNPTGVPDNTTKAKGRSRMSEDNCVTFKGRYQDPYTHILWWRKIGELTNHNLPGVKCTDKPGL